MSQRTTGAGLLVLTAMERLPKTARRGLSAVALAIVMLGAAPASAQALRWIQRQGQGRSGHAIAYDSQRRVSVMFGGRLRSVAAGATDETWEWDGASWGQRVVVGPSPRLEHAMAFDTARGLTVLFGGAGPTGVPSAETWEWDGGLWRQKQVAGPSARLGHAMSYDSTRGVIVLFGGSSHADWVQRELNDETWEWDGAVWSRRSTSGPPPRENAAMAYDAVRGVTVLYGGCDENGDSLPETWLWDGSTWTLEMVTGSAEASTPAMAFDSIRGVTVLFDGERTFDWNGEAWALRSLAGPTSREEAAVTFDLERGVTVLAGGIGFDLSELGMGLGDTWEWNGQSWTERAVAPQGRAAAAMAFDSRRSVTVLHGGYWNDGIRTENSLSDTWESDGGAWSFRASGIPSIGNTMDYDSIRGVTVLLRGIDTWEWDGSTWAHRASTGPGPYGMREMAFDSARGVMVLCIGIHHSPQSAWETWEWNGIEWSQRVASGPSQLWFLTMTYDAARAVTVLHGLANGPSPLSETWEWDGASWTRASVGGAPFYTGGDFGSMRIEFDSSRSVCVLVGSEMGVGSRTETWEWDGLTWVERRMCSPSPRDGAAMTYDSSRNAMILFGGSTSFPSMNDTWELAAFCPADLTTSNNPRDPGYDVPNGAATFDDFFFFLDQFAAGNTMTTDLTTSSHPSDPSYGVPDGILDGSDFFYFLDLYAAGCP